MKVHFVMIPGQVIFVYLNFLCEQEGRWQIDNSTCKGRSKHEVEFQRLLL